MSIVTIALPDPLVQEASAQGIPHDKLEGITIHLVQMYLEARGATFDPSVEPESDGAAFSRQVIMANRSLFEALARR